MKFKKTILGIGTATLASVPILLSIGCSQTSKSDNEEYPYITNEFRNSLQKHNFEHKNGDFYDISKLSQSTVYDAEINYWTDGDTVSLKNIHSVSDSTQDGIKGKTTWSIRIENIDTPELHVKNEVTQKIDQLTVGKEFEYADAARKFGLNEMPVGSHLKLVTLGSPSYSRIVGSLFYSPNNDGKYKNYGVELIKTGLTLPFHDAAPQEIGGPGSELITMLAQGLADGYNQAIKTRQGMFSEKIHDILGVHGVTDDTIWRWREAPRGEDEAANVYDALPTSK